MSGANEGMIHITKVTTELRAPWRQGPCYVDIILYNGVPTLTQDALAMMMGISLDKIQDAMLRVSPSLVRNDRMWVNVRGYFDEDESIHVLVDGLRDTITTLSALIMDATPPLLSNNGDGDATTWQLAVSQLRPEQPAGAPRAVKYTPETPELVHFFGAMRNGVVVAIPGSAPVEVAHTSNSESRIDALLKERFAEQEERLRAMLLEAILSAPAHQQRIEERAAELARERVDAFFVDAARERKHREQLKHVEAEERQRRLYQLEREVDTANKRARVD